MIGVMTREQDRDVVREFFQLFKTPWEFVRPQGDYDAVISTAGGLYDRKAQVQLYFNSQPGGVPDASRVRGSLERVSVNHNGSRIPIYGRCMAFDPGNPKLLICDDTASAATHSETPEGTVIQVGYDLFAEVRFLLTSGQPPENAEIPTLDLHIALLRDLIVSAGVALVEIPPVPAGYTFTACLTHDVDHPVLRNHKVDHTALGFLYRATGGSALNLLRGRISFRDMLRNWSAALRFPLVHLGLARDFWKSFDRYLDLEAGLASTFFIIPRGGDPGRRVVSSRAKRRAARYEITDIQDQLARIQNHGGEIGLHGIDAWTGAVEGRNEKNRITAATRNTDVGVRMHWLCFDENSAAALDEAGFLYDSSFGYNETVGYRAGTLQAYRPPGATRLLELPLHIMDTALFYPDYRNLSPKGAAKVMRKHFSDAVRLGGVLTLNWHDRSIAPERLWGEFYTEMLGELKQLGPWFATASEAASWFLLRRSAVFEEVRRDGRVVKVKVKTSTTAGALRENLPGLQLRVFRSVDGGAGMFGPGCCTEPFSQETFRSAAEITLAA